MRRHSIVLTAGLALGVLGAGLVFAYVRGVEARAAADETMVPVLVAAEAITAGTPGSDIAHLVEPSRIPRRWLPPRAITETEGLEGLVAAGRIDRGSVLTAADLAPAGTTGGRLPLRRGREALVVSTTLAPGLGRYAVPGDRVSAYATFRSAKPFTRKILANVEVLATAPNPDGPKPAAGASDPARDVVLVLAVTPAEASRLVFAQEIGKVWFTLVPRGQRSRAVSDYGVDLTAGNTTIGGAS